MALIEIFTVEKHMDKKKTLTITFGANKQKRNSERFFFFKNAKETTLKLGHQFVR